MATSAAEARRQLAGRTIWLWHYLHADWQWEQSRAWHEDRYALAVAEVLDLMRRNAEVTYYFDTASEFFEPVARKLGPRIEELKERVREGRIRVVSAQVANPRPNQVGDETYLRNLQIGRAFFEAALPPTDLSLFHSVDIAIGHSQMPQILRQAGFRYYRAWRPHGPMNALGIPHQFVWEGLDGSRIPVTRGSYGGFFFGDHVPHNFAEDWDGAVSRVFDTALRDQLLHDRSPSGQLWLTQGCDDARPLRIWTGDRPFDLLGFLGEWARREEAPIRWCTPVEFSQAVAEQEERLPTVRGVIDGCDCSYNAADAGANGLWTWRLFNDRRLLRAERWAAAAEGTGAASAQEELRLLWRQHLTYQAHAQEFSFNDDLDELIDLGRDVKFRAERIERDALVAIAQAAGGGDRHVQYVFNPHPWAVEADVELYHPCAVAGVESIEVEDEDGAVLPQQLLAEFRHPRYAGSVNDQRRLVRVVLPSFGYRRLRVVERAETAAARPAAPVDGVLETADLRLVYRDHALREVHDGRSGHIYGIPSGAPFPGLTFHALDDQNWLFQGPETGREDFRPERGEWLQTGPLRWRHRAHGVLGPYQARVDTIVADRGREVQVTVRLEGHWEQPPTTGFVTLLTDVGAGGQLTVDVPFGVEQRDPDNDIYDGNVPTNRDLGEVAMFERLRPGFFWARSWTDWSGAGHGLTVLGADGNFYWQKDGEAFGPVLLRAIKLVPDSWEAFCTPAFTGTGVHEFTYVLRFHDGDWRAADPQRRAAELHLPPRAVRPNHPTEAVLPASHSFLTVSGPATLSACYADGEDRIVRLYEHEGRGGEVTMTFDRAPGSARAVDLLGQTVDAPVAVRGNEVRVGVRPWQIVTVRVAP